MTRRKKPVDFNCHYCYTAPATTWDHIVPKKRGGPRAKWNLVPSCQRCNNDKRDYMPTCVCSHCRAAVDLWRDKQNLPRTALPKVLDIPNWMQ